MYELSEIKKKEIMRKSKIYTKTGDKGTTSLVWGKRVSKAHVRLDAYGTIDELNSFVGLLICSLDDEANLELLSYVQHRLFTIGSHLATETETMAVKPASIISDADIKMLEDRMDEIDSNLPKLNKFTLPGGSESAARAHICRTICRRAERCIYRVKEDYPVEDNTLMYVNRLSDYFFLLARKECNDKGTEIFWEQNV